MIAFDATPDESCSLVTAEEMATLHANQENTFNAILTDNNTSITAYPVSESCLVPNPFADLTRQRDEALARAEAAEKEVAEEAAGYEEMLSAKNAWADRALAAERDRDAWSAKCAEQATEMDRLRTERDKYRAFYFEGSDIRDGLRDEIAQLEQCVAALFEQYVAALQPPTAPAPNPFREHRHDPRRIGG